MTSYEKSEVLDGVRDAIKRLYARDQVLLEDDTNERSITHKLGEYLQQEFPRWHVDCEYNREGHDDSKRIPRDLPERSTDDTEDDTEAVTVYPDIIIHERGEEKNLLVMEVKKTHHQDLDWDKKKLETFVRGKLDYDYGLLLRIGVDGCKAPLLFSGDQELENVTECFADISL